MRVGKRIYNLTRLTRMFNARGDFRRKHDTLPPKFFEVRADTGWKITRKDLNRLLDEYYRIRRRDREGVPTEELIRGLGLKFCIQP